MKLTQPVWNRGGLALLVVFGLLAVGTIAAAVFYYRNTVRHCRTEMEQNLSAIADLKVGELVQWRKERLGDGNQFFQNPVFADLVRRAFDQPPDAAAQRDLRGWLERLCQNSLYYQIALVDPQGATRLAMPANRQAVSAIIAQRIPEVLRSGQVTFQDFYRYATGQSAQLGIQLGILVPIFEGSDTNRPLGVLVLAIDPARYLYPFIQRWPVVSRTAETLLVRKEGNEAVFLNELRFQRDTALNLRAPLDRVALPAVQAALGREGGMEGIDYRNEPVLAALRGIPDSPWALVARVDIAEVDAPLQAQRWQIGLLVGALLLGALVGIGLIWRQQRIRYYRERAAAGDQDRRMATVVRDSYDAITIQDFAGRITAWNRGAELLYGYSQAEALLMNIGHLTPPAKLAEQEEFTRRLAAGETIVTFEFQRVSKDGRVHDV